MDWRRFMNPFLAGLSVAIFIPTLSAQQTPPILGKSLRQNYTINPSLSPLFTSCAFDGDPTPTITWLLNSSQLPTEDQKPPSGPFYTTEGVLNLERATVGDSGIYTCVGTNLVGQSSHSIIITITATQATPVWIRWWMVFIYAFGLWLLFMVCLVVYFVYRQRTTTRPRRKVPRRRARAKPAEANIEDYECYDESDPSPRYTFANPHADDEGLPTTFNAPFQDQPSQQATGYLNPAFQPNTMYYPTT